MRRILGSALRGRRRRLALVSAIAVVGLGVFAISALAVHDFTFQLDGDVSASTTTNVGGNTQTLDWDSIFTAAGANKSPLPTGFTAAKFTQDFKTTAGGGFDTSDDTTFATGSKDTLDITPGWQCNHDANVNSKIDIMNAYSAAFTSVGGDQIIYFALERNSNAGDGNVGFWFLQDSVGCTSPSGNTPFTGHHRDGDLLIVSAFTNGGSVSNVSVYRWNDPDGVGGNPGSLGTTAVAFGGDCKTQSPGATDSACATVNGPTNGTGGTISTPWQTSNKVDGVGTSLRTSEFFEGGLNLTKTNLAGHCFNVFIGDTRSSQSLTATLFDYAQGQIGECTSTTKTTPVDATDTSQPPGSSIPLAPADAKVTVKDKTVITVNGVSSFTGSISWHVCGPTAASSTATCDTGGVAAGSTNITTAGTYNSPTVTVTAAGRYCFRAEFSGDATLGVPSSSDHSSTECFTVAPVTPTLSTQAVASPVDFGNPVQDNATLSGTANEPGTGGPAGDSGSINPATLGGPAQGTITFTLYKADCTTKATGTGTNPQTVNVNGNGTYGPVSFTPDAPGTYHWVASYSGDSPNTNATSHNTACTDGNEDVVVRQIPTQIKTKQSWIPNDTATVTASTGNLVSGGSVRFQLFDNSTCSSTTGNPLYDETVSVGGGSPSKEVSTSNTGAFTITSDYTDSAGSIKGPYSWKVVYTPAAGDTAHLGVTSTCDAEHFSTTYTNDPGPNS
jgi:hypothetical protein